MRKLLFVAPFLAACAAICACEDEPTNPGDFDVKSTLEVTRIWTATGVDYPVSVVCEKDTVYQASRYDNETDELVWYDTDTRGHLVELSTTELPPEADTIFIKLSSNAKWMAPMPDNGGKAQWFFTQRLAGGGSSTVVATVTRNRNKRRAVDAAQYILTSDSAVIFKVNFAQRGEKD